MAQSQYESGGWQERYIHQSTDSLLLDSLTLVPGSLEVLSRGTLLDSSQYTYHYTTGYLIFAHTPDSLTLRYQLLPFSLHAVHQHKSLVLYDSNAFFNDIRYASFQQQGGLEKETLFASPKLSKTGSISRGISVGNRQSVFVNSSLNLQLEGALTDEINIRAAITDQNIPLQPEGNTQQLQNFDRVFVELYNDHVSLKAGDIVLQQSEGATSRSIRNTANDGPTTEIVKPTGEPYFMRFQRNVQGGQFKVNHTGTAQTDAGIAMSKGRFASVSLDIQEGIQGPYRLKSPDNRQNQATSGVAAQPLDQAYYVLANSEKVYLDGRLLIRGYDEDYTIDYNLGEITFTTNVLLTRNSRVNIDFGYADRSYSRRVLTAGHTQRWGKVQAYARYFQEKDNRNQTLGFALSDDDKLLLSQAGDASTVLISTVDSTGHPESGSFDYQNNYRADVPGVGNLYRVRYQKADTLIEGQSYVAYRFAEDGAFDIDFSWVGQGKGDYVLSKNSVNGKVFVWVVPVNGQSQGSYAPVRQLGTPQNRQMVVAGVVVDVTDKDKIFSEVALSTYDQNTFSTHGDDDNTGKALTVGYESAKRKIGVYHWTTQLRYEYVQQQFTTIDPYRDIEFERHWSVLPAYADTLDTAVGDDHLLYFKAGLEKDRWNRAAYQFATRNRPSSLHGSQHSISLAKSLGHWKFDSQYFLLHSNTPATASNWNKLDADLHYDRWKLVPGYRFRIDKNQVKQTGTDAIMYVLNNYSDHQWYVRSGDSTRSTFQLDYTYQTNYQPLAGQLIESDHNQTIGATSNLLLSERQTLKVRMTYRHNEVLNSELVDLTNFSMQENTMMGRIDWQGALWKDMLCMDLNYTLANGREIRREFVYVRVPVGEGAYTWRDDNGNGIEEIEEFYEAQYWDERNYVRVYVATNQYVLAYTNQLNWQTNLQFPAQWLKDKGLKSLLARFSNSTFWNIDNKTANKALAGRVNPWAAVAEEDLLYRKNALRSTLFFNRQSTQAGADLGIRMQQRKQLLNTGFEERNLQALFLNARWNLNRSVGLQMATEKSKDEQLLNLSASNAQSRDYTIVSHKISPEINWQPNMNLRISTKYGYNRKNNLQASSDGAAGEHAAIHTASWDVRYNRLLSNSITASAEYINIQYTGDIKSPLSYVMLDALQPGDNVRWTLGWQQKLWNGLQLTANYQGRKSPAQRAIHTGNVMVRALF